MITITPIAGKCNKVDVTTEWCSVALKDAQHPTGEEIGVMHASNGQFVPTVKGLSDAVVAAAKRACSEKHLEHVRSEEQRVLAIAQMESRPTQEASSLAADDSGDDDEGTEEPERD